MPYKDPEKMKRNNAAWHKANPERKKRTNRKHKLAKEYNMTIADYERMYLEQWGMCAICGTSKKSVMESGGRNNESLCVDHCHNSKSVRLLLCNRCNLVLGQTSEDLFVLQRMIDYIKYFASAGSGISSQACPADADIGIGLACVRQPMPTMKLLKNVNLI